MSDAYARLVCVVSIADLLCYAAGIPPSEVFHQGSLPTRYLFTWVSASCAVLEHVSIMFGQRLSAAATSTMQQHDPQDGRKEKKQ